jgi:aerobic carbon-monoxide dehydrogenase medium subunit
MIPQSFDYKRADSVAEAIELLTASDAKLLAGGHSLVPAMKLRLNAPETLVDLGRIKELKGISQDGNDLVIGAMTTHHEIATSALVKQTIPLLAQGASAIGDVQVRNRGTLGGSLAHADPSADWPALILATDATVVCQGPKGTREIQADKFFRGLFSTSLKSNEIITQIRFPIPAAGTKATYQKFVQPASRFAIVGCVVVRHPDGSTKVAFSGVADHPFRDGGVEGAISGKALSEANIAEAASHAASGVEVMFDHYASVEYRRHLARVYAKRALTALS